MWSLFIKINKNLVLAIPVMMAAGFAFGLFSQEAMVKSLKGLIMPLTFLMVYPMMVIKQIVIIVFVLMALGYVTRQALWKKKLRCFWG